MDSTISTKDLKSKLDRKQGITIVETLAPERYREAHIPGALNIPPERIKELAPQLLPDQDAEIVTFGTNIHRHASEYARALAAIGYENVVHDPEGKRVGGNRVTIGKKAKADRKRTKGIVRQARQSAGDLRAICTRDFEREVNLRSGTDSNRHTVATRTGS